MLAGSHRNAWPDETGTGGRTNRNTHDSHCYLPAVPFTELKNLISNSRFVLHHSPGFEQGQHERVVYPLARGTSVLSSATRYLFESYGSDNGVAFYNSMAELKQISVSVSEGHYSSWINNANSTIVRNETWRSRIAIL